MTKTKYVRIPFECVVVEEEEEEEEEEAYSALLIYYSYALHYYNSPANDTFITCIHIVLV